MAFVVAGIIWVIGTVIAFLSLFASGMSDSPSAAADMRSTFWTILFGSWIAAAFVASTHWVHLPW